MLHLKKGKLALVFVVEVRIRKQRIWHMYKIIYFTLTSAPIFNAMMSGQPLPELKKNVLRLYNMRFCPYAQRTRLVLAHKQVP